MSVSESGWVAGCVGECPVSLLTFSAVVKQLLGNAHTYGSGEK